MTSIDQPTEEIRVYFTIEEANAILPHITSLLSIVQKDRDTIRTLLQQGTPESDERIQELIGNINDTLDNIHETGCMVKDLDTGLIDFYAQGENGDILLCWKLGEEEISFWHTLDSGFGGREPISTLLGSHLRPLH